VPTAIVCDDDLMSRQVLRGLLVDAGFEVVGEVDMAISALDLVTVTRPDVLVVDVNMPGLSGAEIVRDVNERCPKTAVIVVSAFDVDHLERLDIGEAVILPKTDLVRFDEVLAEVANRGSASTA
jgi:two-component system chemotaxis response regulator CheY